MSPPLVAVSSSPIGFIDGFLFLASSTALSIGFLFLDQIIIIVHQHLRASTAAGIRRHSTGTAAVSITLTTAVVLICHFLVGVAVIIIDPSYSIPPRLVIIKCATIAPPVSCHFRGFFISCLIDFPQLLVPCAFFIVPCTVWLVL